MAVVALKKVNSMVIYFIINILMNFVPPYILKTKALRSAVNTVPDGFWYMFDPYPSYFIYHCTCSK